MTATDKATPAVLEQRDAATVAGHTFDRGALPLVLTLGLGVFAGAFDLGVLSPALPAIGRAFGLAPRDLAWVFTVYLFANVVSIPIMSKLSDARGRRPVYVACLGIFALGSAIAIAAPSYAIFLVARIVQALGAGGIFPVAAATIADRVALERRGSALGMLGAVWGVAGILGPAAGGVITHFISWRWIFAANVPLAIFVIALAMRHVQTSAARRRGPLDVRGIGLLSLGLLGTMVGLTRIDSHAASIGGPIVAIAIAVAVLAFAGLAMVERTALEPVLAPQFFAKRQLVVTYALEIGIGMLEGTLFFIPAALVAADHVDYARSGFIAALGAVAFVAVIPLSGRALDAVGSRIVLLCGALLTGAGLWLFGVNLTSIPLAIASIVVAGVGFGALLGAPTRYIVTNEVPSDARASGVGLLSVFLIIGQIVGGSLAGGIIGNDLADAAGFRSAYLTFAMLAGIVAVGAAFLKSRTQERTPA